MTLNLFSPLSFAGMQLPNRVVMAPMTRSRASADHVPTALMVEHYAARAEAGLLITEGTAPTANGCGYARIPGLWNAAQVEGWRAVTDAVHAKGGRIAVQLMDCGRVGHPLNLPEGAELVGPSPIGLQGQMWTDQSAMQAYPVPREMTEADVQATIAGFVAAAKNAVAAGFDLVELHGANGYLIDQFWSPCANQRADGWGGDREGRGRFALEVARQVAAAIGADKVGIRLSPYGVFNDITPWPELEADFLWLAGQLGALGLAYLHVVDHSSMGAPAVPDALKQGMRAAFGAPFILSGGFDGARANAELEAGKGELVAFGRPFIANPDLVKRLQAGIALAQPEFATFYSPGPEGYNDYPAAG